MARRGEAGTAGAHGDATVILFDCGQLCRRCASGDGEQEKRPNLHGMFGRQAGTNSGYAFSDALKSSGVTWTEETLEQFLAEPRTYIPGNTMSSPAIRKPEDRANLIAYLRVVTK